MKNKIIAFIGVFLVLVAALVVPISALVPAGVTSYVNFFDYMAIDGEIADIYGYDEVNDVITLIGSAEFEYSNNIDGFYVTCDYQEYEGYDWIYFVFSNTLSDVAPYLDPLSYEMGIYVGSAGSDSAAEVRMGGFSNDQFNWLFDSYSNQYSFDDIMGDFFCIAAGVYTQHDFIEFYYPMIFTSVTHEFDYVDTTMFGGEAQRFYTVFNEDYFLGGSDDDGSYDDGYDAGYDVGYGDGFNQGLQQFAGAIKGNSQTIFNTAIYTMVLADEETSATYDITPNVFNGSVFFDESLVPNNSYYEYGYIEMSWSGNDVWVWGSYTFKASGYFDLISLYDGIRNKKYYLNESDIDIYGIYPLDFSPDQSITYPVYVSSIRIYFETVGLYNGLSLISDSSSYNKGYDTGFADGLIANGELAYNEGLRTGYNNGYLEGKAEGLELAKDGSFASLITALIDAPIKAFTSLLDFEVLGINMNKVVGSLFVTVLFIILCKYALRA